MQAGATLLHVWDIVRHSYSSRSDRVRSGASRRIRRSAPMLEVRPWRILNGIPGRATCSYGAPNRLRPKWPTAGGNRPGDCRQR
ncbi:hypothetical protein I545_1524 [Mycobacterium kansasii 662]|uniref:Uncharacterized protein n=2 Tax=Mycobacterium kansasii TaxID=1768 RepID=A0A1V3WDM3_MYCKA|nr:hypothetical protein I545_1524 [Mycobacterium kansasii 662]KEP42476.1 hypothetical protein MKSMC1_24060 [Mycobacterium kansasii]OOK64878.1 hypothetical protein BZL30_8888 [Mycobacterium kansasii]